MHTLHTADTHSATFMTLMHAEGFSSYSYQAIVIRAAEGVQDLLAANLVRAKQNSQGLGKLHAPEDKGQAATAQHYILPPKAE